MLRRLELSPDAHRRLIERCASRNITFLSTPFDEESVDLLDSLDVPLFKIPSGEVTNLPFLEHVARKGRPVILSTGMATLKEVEAAVAALAGVGPLVLLHCVSTYPADPADVNLRAMHTLAETFDVPVGYSDHTIGNDVPLAAVALGACVVEKHLTLDRAMAGPDHSASAEPSELRALVRGIRSVEKALGHGRKEAVPAEAMTAAVARRTLVAACDIPPGTAITGDMLLARRAGGGLAPGFRQHVVGKLATRAIPEGAVIELDMFQ
jgi:sialic acid synthase SpsE